MRPAHRAATRFQLMRTVRRLARVRDGADRLSRKRRALVAELFRVARPAVDARRRIQESALSAYHALLRAQALRGHGELAALARPPGDPRVELRASNVWGVAAAEIVSRSPLRRTLIERGTVPGWTGPAAVHAAGEFEQLTELLLDAASRELLLRQLAHALRATSRQLNVLERRVAPALAGEIARIRASLDEREREDRTRYKQLLRRRARP